MKKIILILFGSFAIAILFWIIWRNLPIAINRASDINFGNKIIQKIENYQKTNKLPESNDWNILKNFGFKENSISFEPEYSKLNDDTFELIFLEGFDGPYLMWNSKERKWKKDQPTAIDN